MKNTTMCLTVGLAFCAAFAAAEEAAVKEESKVEQRAEQGPGARLKSEYEVDDARVDGLREKKLGYGEISKVLALAEKMPGGITDANVDKIVALRKGPPIMGWGQIAKQQGVKLGKTVGKGAEKQAAKPEGAGKPETAGRPEKAARPERPAHGKH